MAYAYRFLPYLKSALILSWCRLTATDICFRFFRSSLSLVVSDFPFKQNLKTVILVIKTKYTAITMHQALFKC